uniref:Uncharacterized protein n=1 Tax=Oryza meridionalis TaxID=40149 RepID=A0A0E0DYI5_9ORYZ
MATVPSVTAFFGLLVSMYATGFFPYVDVQSGGESCVVRARPPLDAAVHTMLLTAAVAMVGFNIAVALIYARLGGGGGGGAVDRRIPRVVYLILFASSGVLHVFLAPQPGAIDGGQDLLPLAAVAVARVLRPSAAAATFFLSMTLIYAHVRAGGEAGAAAAGAAAGNVPIPTTTVELLAKLVLAAALVTVVLTLTATVLAASYADLSTS